MLEIKLEDAYGYETDEGEAILIFTGKDNFHEVKEHVEQALSYYAKKNKYYEMKQELQDVITRKNTQLQHIKKRYSRLWGKIREMYNETNNELLKKLVDFNKEFEKR